MLAKKRKFSATESMQVGNGPVGHARQIAYTRVASKGVAQVV